MRPDRYCRFAHGLTADGYADRARELLSGLVTLRPHASTPIADPPDWAADPYGDKNWRFQLHTLRWAQALKRTYDDTGEGELADAYLAILADWQAANPWDDPPADQSWGDHSTALRARVYAACAEAFTEPLPSWLRIALDEHVDVLCDPAFHPSGGNHALNQNVGLFAAATMAGRDAEARFAVERTAELLARSVDTQGVTDEQSTEYQLYNYRRYREAADLFSDHGVELPQVFDRIATMARFIGHAAQPDGRHAMIGDGCDDPSYPIPRTIAEFAATRGEAGPRPSERIAVFDRGYVFARTGWGEDRPLADETFLSVRFGPPRIPHGHHDAAAISLYAAGGRVVTNAGKYAYVWDAFRDHVLSRSAQNTVTFPDAVYGPDGGSALVEAHHDDTHLIARIVDHHYPDVTLTRTVMFSLATGAVAVVDRFAHRDGVPVTAEQRFRLDPAFEATVDTDRRTVTAARADGETVTLRQLADAETMRVVRGQETPLDGWVSYRYGERTPSPVVVTAVGAANGLMVTAIAVNGRDQVTFDAASGTITMDGQPVAVG